MSAGRPFRGRLGLARAGYRVLLASALLAALPALVGATMLHPAAALPWLLLPAFTAFFFRDPERTPPPRDDVLLAPADGMLDDIRREPHCAFLPGPVWRLGIYLSLFSVHVQRSPCRATTARSEWRAGARVATHRRGELEGNEHWLTLLHRDGDAAQPLAVRQIAGPVARGIVNVLRPGSRIAAGERFGLIRFGSRVELFVPVLSGVRPCLPLGSRVRAGVTVLCEVAPAGSTAGPARPCSATPRCS